MRLFFIFFIMLLISGCMETPELSSSKKDIAQTQIESNKNEAEQAKEEYIKIQRQRHNE